MADEYRVSQVRAEVLVKVDDGVVPSARISQVRTEVLVKHEKSFPPDGHRYHRFRIISTENDSTTGRIAEIRLYSPLGKDITFPNRWSADAGVNLDPETFDGSTNTGYDTQGTMPVILSADAFDAGEIEIASYSLTARSGSSRPYMADEWYLEYSDDGATWFELDHRVGITWGDGETKTFVVPGGAGGGGRRRGFMSFIPN